MTQYDVAVIGAGPGGYVAVIRAAQLGMVTLLVERADVGGTCLNRGCIPTKALLQTAHEYYRLQHGVDGPIKAKEIELDLGKMMAQKDRVVTALRKGIAGLLESHGVLCLQGEATLAAPGQLKVEDELYCANNIVLATGSEPILPAIPTEDGAKIYTSNEVLSMETLPASVAIIGGGVIGVEFAELFSCLGITVTVLEKTPALLPGFDDDICSAALRHLKRRGVKIVTGAEVTGIGKSGCFYLANGAENSITPCVVISAVGRRPYTKNLGLEELGVEMKGGYVQVNEHMQTNLPGLYAIGDITGHQQLAHVASAGGIVAAHTIAGYEKALGYTAIPACVYLQPEIACIGLTEHQAIRRGLKIKVGRFPCSGNGRSLAAGNKEGFIKLLAEEDTGKILGCHIFATNATEMIAEIALAMENNLNVEAIAGTIHPHPTVSEMILEAAHHSKGLCCHLPPRLM